jgi:hypothetical protein
VLQMRDSSSAVQLQLDTLEPTQFV